MTKLLPSVLVLFFTSAAHLQAAQFTGSFDLVALQEYPNGNERSDTISYYFGENQTAMVLPGRGGDPEFRLVFDPQAATITGLFEMNGRKGGYVLPMTEEQWPGMHEASRDFGSGPRTEQDYTGEEKEIEGHRCREVLAESDEYRARMCVAVDIPLSITRVLSYQSVGKGKANEEAALFDQFGVEGLPLELFLESKKDKADVTIRLVNFSDTVDEAVFSKEGHTLMEPTAQ